MTLFLGISMAVLAVFWGCVFLQAWDDGADRWFAIALLIVANAWAAAAVCLGLGAFS